MLQFYCYYLHYRAGEPNPFTCSGRLSDQIIVNAYSCVEANRLNFHALNQDKLRSETYQGITDAVAKGAQTGKDVGIKMILPASFTGSRRYMVQNYHDSMALCRAYGAPDLFSTFTCNPKWPEIAEALRTEPGQCPSDRSDIVTRVYHMKLEEYLADIKDGSAFGPIRAGIPDLPSSIYMSDHILLPIEDLFSLSSFTVIYTTEFQKRGLPHVHVLKWLKDRGDIPTPTFIDSIIFAEIPDVVTDPLGYALVGEFMMHGPCGEQNPRCPCVKKGKCSKWYPKQFHDETTVDADGFPRYRRRDNGRFIVKHGVKLDNRFVVPHNLPLLKKYQAHLNVE